LWTLPFTVTSKGVSKDGMGSVSDDVPFGFREEELCGVVGALCFHVEAIPFCRNGPRLTIGGLV
jgi:hypothetical protein